MKLKIIILILTIISTLMTNAQTIGLTSSLNSYSFHLYREIKVENENLFFSPLSTYLALMIPYEGARSDTKQEFDKVLHIDNPDLLNDIEGFFSNLINWKDSSNFLNISNAIWIQEKYKIESTYLTNIQKYKADMKSVDFMKRQEVALEINNWVSKKTNNLIKNIVSPNDINEYTRLIISNAIYFIGKWADEFERRLTKLDDFYSISNDVVQTDFMNKTEFIKYFENDEFQFVSIPYKGHDKSFCIILPQKRYGLTEIENKLNEALLNNIFNNLEYPKVILSIPKFRLETNYSLIEPLKNLGMKTAFTANADFSGITTEEPLLINKINHKAYIEIDEEKTEAAAVTTVELMAIQAIGPAPKPKIFKADHPFIFLILDNKTKGIIFMGRYVKT
jgi:serpin B